MTELNIENLRGQTIEHEIAKEVGANIDKRLVVVVELPGLAAWFRVRDQKANTALDTKSLHEAIEWYNAIGSEVIA